MLSADWWRSMRSRSGGFSTTSPHGDACLADDLAQDTFLKAYESVRSFKGLSGFRTWLYKIACNLYYSHQRSRRELT